MRPRWSWGGGSNSKLPMPSIASAFPVFLLGAVLVLIVYQMRLGWHQAVRTGASAAAVQDLAVNVVCILLLLHTSLHPCAFTSRCQLPTKQTLQLPLLSIKQSHLHMTSGSIRLLGHQMHLREPTLHVCKCCKCSSLLNCQQCQLPFYNAQSQAYAHSKSQVTVYGCYVGSVLHLCLSYLFYMSFPFHCRRRL
jgi:hypothetical protein